MWSPQRLIPSWKQWMLATLIYFVVTHLVLPYFGVFFFVEDRSFFTHFAYSFVGINVVGFSFVLFCHLLERLSCSRYF
jgi:hypothetical protein